MAEGEHQAKVEKRQAQLSRHGDDHIKNCGGAPIAISAVHHILCITCMAKRFNDYKKGSPDIAAYIERCLDITPWDINDGHNQIRLPKKKQYFLGDPTFPGNLVCHDVDHPTYTDEISEHLKTEVWNKLCQNQEPHKVDSKSIKGELDGVSTTFRTKLMGRALRPPGTAVGWAKRHEDEYADTWYHPFSMAEDPYPRSPGSRTSLSGIFDRLK
jgi:hypothetical protein